MMRSGNSSRILLIISVPMPEPVPPPRECVSWKPCRQSQPSASFLTTSRTESTSSAPSTKLSGLKIWPKGPDLTESMVPGSKSTSTARGQLLFAFIFKLALLLSGGVLVLLVLRHQVVHVALSLCELHLIHALASWRKALRRNMAVNCSEMRLNSSWMAVLLPMKSLYLYCWLPRLVRGAKPGMKKCSLGKGTMLTASFLRSALSWPGKRRQVVTPLMVAETSWWTERVALYGSTTVSETWSEGTTLKVFMMRSGYSSRILLIISVPMPEPVPPPRECVSWKPCRQSQPSASFLTTSRTESTSSAPSASSSSPSSSNSPSSSAVASWYCWYSETRSFMLLSASVNSISSMPSPSLYLYCWLPRLVRGAKPGMKKCSLGKGTMLTASFLRSALSWPGKRRQVVTPLMVAETSTLGEGTTLKVVMMRSGYSSRILLISSVPMPEPVPPPRECVSWKPCRQSQLSASFLTTSRTESTSSAPSVYTQAFLLLK
ncbi:hypothetical protein F7725_007710 [Dissostichus mawsoni]|uniref:Uncharacterized protein n=1 Tax=Dissostichus mawsoni TaxID=36200 RepID=A0A7J5Y7D1_DISMA|nr:hypothetical protein F7725_007710 [Dissostichus mawsoni]